MLLERLRERLVQPDSTRAGLRELASACDATPTTLRHYFGRRDDLVAEVLREHHVQAAAHLARSSQPSGPLEESVREAVERIGLGFSVGRLGEVYALGLVEGLRNKSLGPAFLENILEPTLKSLTARLAEHQARGEMRDDVDARAAAIALVSPVLIAFLHQRELGGSARWPLDLSGFLVNHAAAFVRAYGTSALNSATAA